MKLLSTFATSAVGGFAAAACYYLYLCITTDDPMADDQMEIYETFLFSPLTWAVVVIFAALFFFTQMYIRRINQTRKRDSSDVKSNSRQLKRLANSSRSPKSKITRSRSAPSGSQRTRLVSALDDDNREEDVQKLRRRSAPLREPLSLSLSQFLSPMTPDSPQPNPNGTEDTGEGLCAILRQLFRDITGKR